MTSFVDCPVDSNAILGDIERLVRDRKPDQRSGRRQPRARRDRCLVRRHRRQHRAQPDRRSLRRPAVRALPPRPAPSPASSCSVTSIPCTRSACWRRPLPFRREGDKVYGPGIYDMKGGLVLAIAAWQRLARAKVNLPLPITFLFNPDEEVGSVASRRYIEAEAARNRYVLVTEPKRNGGKIVTQRKGTGRFLIRAHGRPAHSGGSHEKGRSAIRAMAAIILRDRGLHRLCARHHHQCRPGQRRHRRQRDPGVLHHRGRPARLRHGRGGRDGAEVPLPSGRATRTSRSTVTGGLNRPPFVRGPQATDCSPRRPRSPASLGLKLESRWPVGRRLRRQFDGRQGRCRRSTAWASTATAPTRTTSTCSYSSIEPARG